ncbi:hypothetical protein FVE85_6174 [Porphyridium purpureum]|uniref:Uncharacterized protein n=1 Tax=Porphyridium purpureum TaxID=35688 RepID=A0A5J4Z3N4_PORPP|nr:hypothetical protein FVE85_6174 [Porphyridium purpureum]|eukprot:POR5609..scf295_1
MVPGIQPQNLNMGMNCPISVASSRASSRSSCMTRQSSCDLVAVPELSEIWAGQVAKRKVRESQIREISSLGGPWERKFSPRPDILTSRKTEVAEARVQLIALQNATGTPALPPMSPRDQMIGTTFGTARRFTMQQTKKNTMVSNQQADTTTKITTTSTSS